MSKDQFAAMTPFEIGMYVQGAGQSKLAISKTKLIAKEDLAQIEKIMLSSLEEFVKLNLLVTVS